MGAWGSKSAGQGVGEDPQAERECILRTLRGEPAGFEELVYRYEAKLLRFLETRCGNRHDAEDLAQRTFVKAYRALARFDTGRPFGPWLYAIARNEAVSLSRERRAAPLPEQGPEPAAPEAGRPDDSIWETARRHLTERAFSALWMTYAEGFSLAETGRALGVTALHARVILFRARRVMAEALRKERP